MRGTHEPCLTFHTRARLWQLSPWMWSKSEEIFILCLPLTRSFPQGGWNQAQTRREKWLLHSSWNADSGLLPVLLNISHTKCFIQCWAHSEHPMLVNVVKTISITSIKNIIRKNLMLKFFSQSSQFLWLACATFRIWGSL